jgi:hypothetical protein
LKFNWLKKVLSDWVLDLLASWYRNFALKPKTSTQRTFVWTFSRQALEWSPKNEMNKNVTQKNLGLFQDCFALWSKKCAFICIPFKFQSWGKIWFWVLPTRKKLSQPLKNGCYNTQPNDTEHYNNATLHIDCYHGDHNILWLIWLLCCVVI